MKKVYNNPDWMKKFGSKALSDIEASITEFQNKELVMCQLLVSQLLDSYDIDDKDAQEWKDEEISSNYIVK
ncbi:hypothetical protein DSO57_1035536 [Entomophthora muscae]|uniref:Uncharacterized protein n=1 Tax=Entomophthora muscae TaxID=34485 RepID=A0ACC2S1F8_9FUNG|nr:hypothetical protein DSO57_1035536 [Entomophthora muscae]